MKMAFDLYKKCNNEKLMLCFLGRKLGLIIDTIKTFHSIINRIFTAGSIL